MIIPSSPKRAYGLLLSAMRNPDPVIFLEPKRIYRLTKQQVEDNGKALPIGKCFTLKSGEDVTLISWGASVFETIQAAQELEKINIDAEVIDLASIKPLDIDSILNSVEKTGRCVIIHEAAKTCGVGAEISAEIHENLFSELLAPVQRVTGYDTVMPYFQLEKNYIPSVKRIVDSVVNIME